MIAHTLVHDSRETRQVLDDIRLHLRLLSRMADPEVTADSMCLTKTKINYRRRRSIKSTTIEPVNVMQRSSSWQ
jgi:hypothetical protein